VESLESSLKPLDWDEILSRLEKFATSEPARNHLRKLAPLSSSDEAEKSFREILEAQMIMGGGERPFMESLDLYSTWAQRLKRDAVLQTLELRDVRRFCIEVVALSEVIRLLHGTWIDSVKTRLMDATEALSAIDQLMTPSGEIRTDASEALYNLHREKTQQTRALQTTLDKLVKSYDMEPVLQDKYVTTREGRWVLPVKGGMQRSLPGIVHGQSQSKQTVFIEPDEVVPLNNRLKQIDAEIEEEIERLMTELSNYLATQILKFDSSYHVMLEVDIRLAQGKLSEVLDASPPIFTEDTVDLVDVRHPLLVLKNENVIPNTVRLTPDRRILLLSGPNAGGKTVLLKSVGLASQMARCGLPICADEGSKLPFFNRLHVGVGDAQSVDAKLSTFAAHIKVLDEAAKARGAHEMVLIDEICGSTDPEEGSALARSFIENYASNKVFGVITSHLGPLKVGWENKSGVINGSLE
jgi:DNA mismatch repair protein MutS2